MAMETYQDYTNKGDLDRLACRDIYCKYLACNIYVLCILVLKFMDLYIVHRDCACIH